MPQHLQKPIASPKKPSRQANPNLCQGLRERSGMSLARREKERSAGGAASRATRQPERQELLFSIINQNTSRAERRALPPPGAGPGGAEAAAPGAGPAPGAAPGRIPEPTVPPAHRLGRSGAAGAARHQEQRITRNECPGVRGCRARLSPRGPPAAPRAPRPGAAAPRLPRSPPGPALPAAPLRAFVWEAARPGHGRALPARRRTFPKVFPGERRECGSRERGRGARGAHP